MGRFKKNEKKFDKIFLAIIVAIFEKNYDFVKISKKSRKNDVTSKMVLISPDIAKTNFGTFLRNT